MNLPPSCGSPLPTRHTRSTASSKRLHPQGQSSDDRREYHLEITQKYIDYYNISTAYMTAVMNRIPQRFTPGGVRQAGGDAHHHQPGADGRSGDSRRPFGTKQLKKRHRLSACAAAFQKQSLRNADIRSGGPSPRQSPPAGSPRFWVLPRGLKPARYASFPRISGAVYRSPQRVQPCIRVPLAEPLSIASQKQREMVKRRCLQSQQPIQQQLPGGGRQQVRTPHYFCDAHGRVIHHHRQLIGKYAVRPPQQKIPRSPQAATPCTPPCGRR